MPSVKVGKSEIFYLDHGEGDVVVLAHGVGGNHAIWFRQVDVLSRSYRVIAFDHRGFGRSTDVEGFGRTAFVSDLMALLDHIGVDKAAFVGQSMGGGTCVALSALHPERVRALVLASSLHGFEETDTVREIMDKARAATDGLDQLDRVLDEDFRRTHPAEALLYSAIAGFNATTRKTLTGTYAAKLKPDQAGRAGIPVLFIAAERDKVFPAEAVSLLQQQVAGSYLVEINDAGHSAFFERPTEFNDSVLSFLMMAGLKPKSRPAHSNAPGYTKVSGA